MTPDEERGWTWSWGSVGAVIVGRGSEAQHPLRSRSRLFWRAKSKPSEHRDIALYKAFVRAARAHGVEGQR